MIAEDTIKKLSSSALTGKLTITTQELKQAVPFLLAVNQRYNTQIFQEEIIKFNSESMLKAWENEIIQGVREKDIKSIRLLFRLIVEPVNTSKLVTKESLVQDLLNLVVSESIRIGTEKVPKKYLH